MKSLTISIMSLCLLACGGLTASSSDAGTSSDGAVTDSAGLEVGADAARDFAACVGPGTCEIADRTCCGVCGSASFPDLTAISRAVESSYRASVCAPGTDCPGCIEDREPNAQAFCVANRCTVIDVRTDPVSACKVDSDCRVRVPDCCECGASTAHLIALATSEVNTYASQVCAPDESCAFCLPTYPPRVLAQCDTTTHHCRILLAP
jgi:hypothetical protein